MLQGRRQTVPGDSRNERAGSSGYVPSFTVMRRTLSVPVSSVTVTRLPTITAPSTA